MESSVELRSEDAGLTIRAEHPGRATLTGEGYLRPLQYDNHNAELIGYILAGRLKLQFEPKPVAVRELKANACGAIFAKTLVQKVADPHENSLLLIL